MTVKIRLTIPEEAAQRILADVPAFLQAMKEQGMEVLSVGLPEDKEIFCSWCSQPAFIETPEGAFCAQHYLERKGLL